MLAKVFIGIGVLDLPYGFSESGLLFSFLIYFITSYIGIKAQCLIIDISFFELNKKFIQKQINDKSSDSDQDEHQHGNTIGSSTRTNNANYLNSSINSTNTNTSNQPENNVSNVCSCITVCGFNVG